MHPEAHNAMARDALRLGQLGVVVREHVVRATGVNVEPLAQNRHRHRRALDVPAREAWAPRAGPDLEAVLARRLPQREVARVSLAGVDLAPRSDQQLVRAVAG